MKTVPFEEKAISYLIEVLQDHSTHGISNPDDVSLALAINEQYPKIVNNSQWKKAILHSCETCESKWLNPHILHHDNLTKLSEAIHAKTSKFATETQPNYENRMHSVWNTIIQWFISPPGESHKKNMVTFETFWKVVVDECLFHEDTTHHRKFWGFQLFEKALTSLPLEKTPSIFTPNLLRTLMNNFVDKSRYLHEAVMHILSVFEQVDKDKAVIIVMQLLGHNCNKNFDRFFNTKAIKKVFGTLDSEALEQYLSHLKKNFLYPNEIQLSENRSIEQHRQWIVNHLYTFLKDSHVKCHEGFSKSILDFFTIHGFFVSKDLDTTKDKKKTSEVESHTKSYNTRSSKRMKLDTGISDNSEKTHVLFELPIPKLSEKTQKCCRTRFFHALGELCSIRSLDHETSSHKLNGTMSDGCAWAYYAVNLMKKYDDDSRIEPLIILSNEAQKMKDEVIILLQQINDKVQSEPSTNDSTNTLQYKGFILLFSFSILALYIEPDDSMSALKSSKKLKNTNENNQDMHNPVDVIVDILLGFLAKPSSFLHKMSEQIFKIFCGDITKSSLDVMIELLNKKKDNEDDQMMDIDDVDEG
ncbi:13519_t:CDS:10, partial [Racocetra persica]